MTELTKPICNYKKLAVIPKTIKDLIKYVLWLSDLIKITTMGFRTQNLIFFAIILNACYRILYSKLTQRIIGIVFKWFIRRMCIVEWFRKSESERFQIFEKKLLDCISIRLRLFFVFLFLMFHYIAWETNPNQSTS